MAHLIFHYIYYELFAKYKYLFAVSVLFYSHFVALFIFFFSFSHLQQLMRSQYLSQYNGISRANVLCADWEFYKRINCIGRLYFSFNFFEFWEIKQIVFSFQLPYVTYCLCPFGDSQLFIWMSNFMQFKLLLILAKIFDLCTWLMISMFNVRPQKWNSNQMIIASKFKTKTVEAAQSIV